MNTNALAQIKISHPFALYTEPTSDLPVHYILPVRTNPAMVYVAVLGNAPYQVPAATLTPYTRPEGEFCDPEHINR